MLVGIAIGAAASVLVYGVARGALYLYRRFQDARYT